MLEKVRLNIPISKPFIGEEEKQAVLEVLDSGQITQGKKVEAFEIAFAEYHHAKHGIAMNNGTTTLMAALMAHGVKPGDEVIIPSFSFFATASCISFVGAVPVFADIDPKTFNMSPAAAEAAITPRTTAIMPVHLYGQIADMSAFKELCDRKGLVLIEDAAQAHGATLNGKFAGAWGTASFSFYATKNMTTTEGGMILTNDDALAAKLRAIRNQGMNQQYYHELIGYNFRMTNLTAAIGLVQLGRLPGWTDKRNENAAFYNANLKHVTTPYVVDGAKHVYHQYTVRVPEGVSRDDVTKQLNANGVGVRIYYPLPIHRQPVYIQTGRYDTLDLPETERAVKEVFSLPIYPALTQPELEYVVEEINSLC